MSIYKKLLEVQKQSIVVTKDSINPHFKNKYASLDAIIAAYSKPLSDNGIVIIHSIDGDHLITTATDVESEENVSTSFPIKTDGTPQNIGSQLTYAKRYNLGQILNIATDEDDDGNGASKEEKKPEKKQPNKNPKLEELKQKWLNKMGKGKGKILENWYKTAYRCDADSLADDQIGEMIFIIQDYTPDHIEEFIKNLENAPTN